MTWEYVIRFRDRRICRRRRAGGRTECLRWFSWRRYRRLKLSWGHEDSWASAAVCRSESAERGSESGYVDTTPSEPGPVGTRSSPRQSVVETRRYDFLPAALIQTHSVHCHQCMSVYQLSLLHFKPWLRSSTLSTLLYVAGIVARLMGIGLYTCCPV